MPMTESCALVKVLLQKIIYKYVYPYINVSESVPYNSQTPPWSKQLNCVQVYTFKE